MSALGHLRHFECPLGMSALPPSILFEDPDGIRLEINFVPGKGNLAEGVTLPLMARPGGAPDQE